MKNRGQIAIFVIIGLIIFAVVGMIVYTFQGTVSKKETPSEILPHEVSDVKEYITSCLNDALEGAVGYCSGNFADGSPKCLDYETDVANRAKEDFCNCVPGCTDFSMFETIEVEVREDPLPKAVLTGDRKKVMVTMKYPIILKKDDSQYMLGTTESPFYAEYSLEQSTCANIKLKNNDYELCEAYEEKTVDVLGIRFIFHEGDKVAVGGGCIAC